MSRVRRSCNRLGCIVLCTTILSRLNASPRAPIFQSGETSAGRVGHYSMASAKHTGPAAIRVGPGSSVVVRNARISGFTTGISSDGGSVRTENVRFENVETPYAISGGNAHVTGTRISNDPKLKKLPAGEKVTGNASATRSSSGWRRLNAPPLPVFCGKCKSIFPSKNYVFAGTYFYSWDNEETCPACGFERAKLSEGLFDLTSEAVRILSAPNITYELVIALREALQDIRSGQKTFDNAARWLDALSVDLGSLLRKARKYGTSAVLMLTAVIGALFAGATVEIGQKQLQISREQLELQRQQFQFDKSNGQSTDQKLEEILKQMQGMQFIPSGSKKTPHHVANNRDHKKKESRP